MGKGTKSWTRQRSREKKTVDKKVAVTKLGRLVKDIKIKNFRLKIWLALSPDS